MRAERWRNPKYPPEPLDELGDIPDGSVLAPKEEDFEGTVPLCNRIISLTRS